jgi:hypothetical protein
MVFRLLVLLLGFKLVGCQKISNNINDIEFECGGSADLGSFSYVKLVGETGSINSAEGLEVTDTAGRDRAAVVTPKGCLKLPKDFTNPLVVARPSSNQGYILYPSRVPAGTVQSHIIKTYRYNALTSPCKNQIVTSAEEMSWPINWAGVESASYDWQLEIQNGKGSVISLNRNGSEDLSREAIDLRGLSDGVYQMQIMGRQLFSKDKVETRIECKLIVDRQSPLVNLDRDYSHRGRK